ncbi:retrovirus-related pol polyprotein from transposon TNT 1-94, partial [Tanacetum coccineum]
MTRSRLHTDVEMCMYALTMSTTKPKNIKEAMLDHSWIESMQDELNQLKRLDVWELVERPIRRNIIEMDVKTAFLNGPLKEEVFVSQLDGFVDPNFLDYYYHLKKALYGLKQAPRAWYDKLSSFLIEHHFIKRIVDPTLFTRRHGDDILLVQIYVDDIIFCLTNPVLLKGFSKLMKDKFEMSMMGEMKFFLRLQIHLFTRGIFISQSQYTLEILKKHGMDGCDSISTLMATARIDADLQDHAGCHNDCKSTSGERQFVGDKLLIIWMRTQLLDYGYRYTKIPMYCDSKSAIAISCNPVQHLRTKNINIRYHFIKDHVEKGTIELYFAGTEYQLADQFSKALPKEWFEYLVHKIGVGIEPRPFSQRGSLLTGQLSVYDGGMIPLKQAPVGRLCKIGAEVSVRAQ